MDDGERLEMQLTVVGCAGSQPGGGQACSGYLVTAGSTNVLVDCGFGVAARVTGIIDPADLDGIVVTHRHLDHCIDLLGLFRILWAGEATVPVFAADEVDTALAPMVKEARRVAWDRIFPWTTVHPGDRWSIGALSLVAHASDHPVPTVSLRITDRDSTVLAYSSDSTGAGDLVRCAMDVDLLLVEATWQDADTDRQGNGHMTATRAGTVAAEADVARLVLTHLRPHLEPEQSRVEAARSFSGPIEVARDGVSWRIERRADR